MAVQQPDGTVMPCFASGDEYINYLHDKDGYTIIQDKQTGYYVYAIREGETLAPGDLAFDHGKIIETGIERLRGKIDYTEIGFGFLENRDAFSLSELQTVFEAVLGETLDSSNFRRAILGRYEKTGQLTQTDQAEKRGRGRPAALYRFSFRGDARASGL